MNANEVDVIFFQAKIQKFDNNFFNFEDPEVYRKFTNPNETDIWKKTYGYDFACTSAVLRSANSLKCNKMLITNYVLIFSYLHLFTNLVK